MQTLFTAIVAPCTILHLSPMPMCRLPYESEMLQDRLRHNTNPTHIYSMPIFSIDLSTPPCKVLIVNTHAKRSYASLGMAPHRSPILIPQAVNIGATNDLDNIERKCAHPSLHPCTQPDKMYDVMDAGMM